MKETFTRNEVINMLVSMFVFAGANNNQGISSIKGKNYGEQAETVIKAHEAMCNENTRGSIIRDIQLFD